MTVLRNTVTEPDGSLLSGWLDVALLGSPFRAATQTEVLGPIKDWQFAGGAWSVELVPGLYVVTQRRQDGAFHSRWTVEVPDSGSPVWLADCLTAVPSTPASVALRAVASTVVDGAGHLQITYSDGTTVDAGPVIGPQGIAGPQGIPGEVSNIDEFTTQINDPATPVGGALRAAFGSLPGTTTKTRVLIIGSSNAAGSSASSTANSWAGLLAADLSATHEFFNEAVSGISPTFWVTPDGTTGRSPLEDAIIEHRPHIVIAAFTTQNSGGPTTTFIGWVDQTINTCARYGVRCLPITPYISESYSAAQKDLSASIGQTIKDRGLWVLNWGSIWGQGATIPDDIDSGDGLHVNNAGHLEQRRQVPTDYLSLSSVLSRPPKFDTVSAGLLVPSGGSGAPPASTNAFPAGSWTVGFEVTLPGADAGGVGLLSFLGANNTTRMRAPGPSRAVDVAGGIIHPLSPDMATGSTHHIALSYNAITRESVLYLDGVARSTATADPGLTFTGLVLGSRADNTSYAATWTFRNLTVHATVLSAVDVARLTRGVVAPASLVYAASLADAPARPAGAVLAAQFGDTLRLTLGLATA